MLSTTLFSILMFLTLGIIIIGLTLVVGNFLDALDDLESRRGD